MELKIKDKFKNDNELLYLAQENNEDAINALYEKYKPIINVIINKYVRSAYALNIDIEELRQEAYVGYVDAVRSYNDDMDTQLRSFITLCINRRLQNYIRLNNTTKMKLLKDAFSFDNEIGEDLVLADVIGDTTSDPETIREQKERAIKIRNEVNNSLSKGEREVLELLLNDLSYEDIASILDTSVKNVYNTVNRIRTKLKGLI